MPVLVIAEHDNKELKPSTLSTIAAASIIEKAISVLVAGFDCRGVADSTARVKDVEQVLICDDPRFEHQLAEDVANLVHSIADDFSHVLAPASTYGKNLLPRIGALLDVSPISDIVSIETSNTFVRPIYAGNAMATVRTRDDKKLMTIRPTAFPAADPAGGSASVSELQATGETGELSRFTGQELTKSERPELTSARVVISGGRGLGSSENFKLIEQLADKLGGAVGASRAAVDAGYAPNDYQVGQTGKVVAPELYIAVGISGAIQHLAGMKDSKVIVAVNKDEEAPIFQITDYGLVGDLFDVLPKLYDALD